jgi:hypothetical protein
VRWIPAFLCGGLTALSLSLAGCATRSAAPALVKVLPHHLDAQGRSALSPSLFDRDAYQAQLRKDANRRGGLRFDVQWRAPREDGLVLQVEVRGVVSNRVTQARLHGPLPAGGRFSQWSELVLDGARYRELGEMTAWRATLWQGTNLLSEQHSFLW